MLHLYDRATIAHALTLDLEPRLRTLLERRIAKFTPDLIDETEFLIVQAGDTEADIVRHIGLSPLIEPYDGERWGSPGFEPHWDLLIAHDGWFEAIFTFGSTFGCILLIEDCDGAPSDVILMCRFYSHA